LTASDTVASLSVMLDNSPTLPDTLKRLPAEAAAERAAFLACACKGEL